MNHGGHVRGQMLAVAIERLNYANIGVWQALGPDWTPKMEAGWQARLAAVAPAPWCNRPGR